MRTGSVLVLLLVALPAAGACGGERDSEQAGAKVPRTPAPAAATSTAKARPAAKAAAAATPATPVDPRRSPQHPVYSLTDNLLSAHLIRGGGLVVPAGSAGVGKYLRYLKQKFPLELGKQRDGVRVGAATDDDLAFHVPLTDAQVVGEPRIRFRLFGEREVDTAVSVNGNKLEPVAAAKGWSTIEITPPAGTLRAGENEIELSVRKGDVHDVAWMQVGGDSFGDDLAPSYDPATGALVLPDGGGLAHYVMVPDEAHLIGAVTGDDCSVSVTATPTDGTPVTGTLQGETSFVDLSALAGVAARLELVASGCPEARLAGAALTIPGEAPTVKRAEPPRYLVLWIMDALRADRVRLFNPKARPEVPVFEELAKSATVFAHNYVQGNESRASHGSIWTSLYPVVHDFLSARGGISTKWLSIDELMKSAGMYTSGISANGYITMKRGFGTKWDQYTNLIHEGGGLSGEWILDKALATVERRKDKPWFLYMGTIDTHATWRAKEPWLSKYDPTPYRGRFVKNVPATDMGEVNAGTLKVNSRDVERIRAMYDANVSYADQVLGTLLEKLDEWGIRDQTMIVITADHGDELFERPNVVGHAKSMRETLVWVPLIIHYPPLFPPGSITEGTEVIDIVPTVADAFGLDWNDQWQGESLVPLAQGVGRGYPRMSFASQFEHTHAGRIGRWKVRAVGKGGEQLFDVKTDHFERRNLMDKRPIEYRLVADPLFLLRMHNAAWKKRTWGNPANTRAGFPEASGE